MSHYKPYPAYKDSGVEWIGKVPEHWKIRPVKHLYQVRLGKMIQPQPKSEEDVLVPYHRAQTVQWERIEHSQVEKMWAHPSEIDLYSLENGDLLICEGGDVCRASVFNLDKHETVIFQNSLHRVRPINDNRPEWLLRLMQHVRSSGWIDVLCNKNTIVHFTSDKLRSLEIPHPPPSEQAEILSTLRRETARIDALIARKTEFIELLARKRQALITHAVTKGLDPNVKMKDSGVEWIGEVPEHWNISPFFTVAKEISRSNKGMIESKVLSLSFGRIIQKRESENLGLVPESYETYQIVEPGEIVFRFTDLQNDKNSLRSAQVKERGIITSAYLAIKPFNVNETYLAWLMRAYDHCKVFYTLGGGLRQSLKYSDVKRLPVVIPPLVEQLRSVDFIDRETARIDALIEKVQLSIDLLKKRRSALITAAVTGQIDLREST